MSNKHYNQVREFHKAFNYKQADKPTPIPTDVVIKRTNYLLEEIIELLYASSGGEEVLFDALVDNLIENAYKEKETVIKKNPDVSDKLVAQLDALVDLNYFNYGNFAIAGVDPEPLFDIVHESNMSKLDPDTGKPIYREDGKVLKGKGFITPEPRLKEEIERQKQDVDSSPAELNFSTFTKSDQDFTSTVGRIQEGTFSTSTIKIIEDQIIGSTPFTINK